MDREMCSLSVFVNKGGSISLSQDDSVVVVHPEQVDLLVKWLKEAQEESKDFVSEEDDEPAPATSSAVDAAKKVKTA